MYLRRPIHDINRLIVRYRTRLPWAPRSPPRGEYELDDVVDALALFDAREHSRPVAAHELRIAVHDLQGGADVRCEVDLQKWYQY